MSTSISSFRQGEITPKRRYSELELAESEHDHSVDKRLHTCVSTSVHNDHDIEDAHRRVAIRLHAHTHKHKSYQYDNQDQLLENSTDTVHAIATVDLDMLPMLTVRSKHTFVDSHDQFIDINVDELAAFNGIHTWLLPLHSRGNSDSMSDSDYDVRKESDISKRDQLMIIAMMLEHLLQNNHDQAVNTFTSLRNLAPVSATNTALQTWQLIIVVLAYVGNHDVIHSILQNASVELKIHLLPIVHFQLFPNRRSVDTLTPISGGNPLHALTASQWPRFWNVATKNGLGTHPYHWPIVWCWWDDWIKTSHASKQILATTFVEAWSTTGSNIPYFRPAQANVSDESIMDAMLNAYPFVEEPNAMETWSSNFQFVSEDAFSDPTLDHDDGGCQGHNNGMWKVMSARAGPIWTEVLHLIMKPVIDINGEDVERTANVICAGGSAMHAMLGSSSILVPDSDIDLFIVGSTAESRNECLRRCITTCFEVVKKHGRRILVWTRPGILTLRIEADTVSPPLQFLNGNFRHPIDVIRGADLSMVSVAWDGHTLWCSLLALASWQTRRTWIIQNDTAMPTATRHGVYGRQMIPKRWVKACRKGFRPIWDTSEKEWVDEIYFTTPRSRNYVLDIWCNECVRHFSMKSTHRDGGVIPATFVSKSRDEIFNDTATFHEPKWKSAAEKDRRWLRAYSDDAHDHEQSSSSLSGSQLHHYQIERVFFNRITTGRLAAGGARIIERDDQGDDVRMHLDTHSDGSNADDIDGIQPRHYFYADAGNNRQILDVCFFKNDVPIEVELPVTVDVIYVFCDQQKIEAIANLDKEELYRVAPSVERGSFLFLLCKYLRRQYSEDTLSYIGHCFPKKYAIMTTTMNPSHLPLSNYSTKMSWWFKCEIQDGLPKLQFTGDMDKRNNEVPMHNVVTRISLVSGHGHNYHHIKELEDVDSVAIEFAPKSRAKTACDVNDNPGFCSEYKGQTHSSFIRLTEKNEVVLRHIMWQNIAYSLDKTAVIAFARFSIGPCLVPFAWKSTTMVELLNDAVVTRLKKIEFLISSMFDEHFTSSSIIAGKPVDSIIRKKYQYWSKKKREAYDGEKFAPHINLSIEYNLINKMPETPCCMFEMCVVPRVVTRQYKAPGNRVKIARHLLWHFEPPQRK